jgi:hypothetical protein
MSEYAKNLYSKAYDSTKVENTMLDNRRMREYMGDPTEIDARKKELEHELERLGVKKYGERFTQEHYNKAWELMNKGKLSYQASRFLQIIKAEYIGEIMNNVAVAGKDVENNNV